MTTKPAAAKTGPKSAPPAADTPTPAAETPAAEAAPVEAPKAYASKDDLKIPVLAEDDVVTLTGRRVRVRGLSRYEADKLPDGDSPGYDVAVLKVALVQPEGMTEADIEAWRRATPTREIFDIINKVTELSGMGPDASLTTMRRGTGRSSSESPLPSQGSSRAADSSLE